MSDEYQRVLRAWAMNHIPRAAEILDVKLEYHNGFWSSVTMDDPTFSVTVKYRDRYGVSLTTSVYDDGFTTMGTMLTELFKIAGMGPDS